MAQRLNIVNFVMNVTNIKVIRAFRNQCVVGNTHGYRTTYGF